MLEVAERLLCTIGHDVLEALFWTATEPNKPKYLVLPHLFLSIIYICKNAFKLKSDDFTTSFLSFTYICNIV